MTLAVTGLSYAYGVKRALDGVTFRAEAGRFTALLGPNGAGKSTLFGLLTGLLRPGGGEIEIAGVDFATAPTRALAQMGIVFQQSTLDLDLTVYQNLRYFCALRGLAGRAAETRIEAALERLDMRARAGETIRALNGGHRRRTEIARALLHAPQVLLLDEPTVGLDAASRAVLTAHVHDLVTDGMAVLWATHLTDEVGPGDHLLVLHQGRLLADGPVGQVTAGAPLSEYFLHKTAVAA